VHADAVDARAAVAHRVPGVVVDLRHGSAPVSAGSGSGSG
jgi:hypothetical protein